MENNKGKILWKGNKQSGITLVALVVTIVVLLILAGVSIRLVLDNNGIITRAGDASSRSKEGSAKEKVELMLSDYYMESLGLISFLEGQDGVDNVTDNGDKTITVEIDGYEVVVDTSKLEVTSCEKSGGVRPEAGYAIYQTTGDATVDGITYTEVVVTVKVTNKSALGSVDEIKMIDSKGNEITKEDTIIGDNTADASFKVSKNGKFTVTIKGTTDNVQKTKNMAVTVNGKITVTEFDRYKTEGKIEVVFIDMDNKIISSPLEPKLVGNMKPIKLNSEGTDFEEVQKGNWGYNYVAGQGTQENTQSIWANAKTNDGSMFVWIPRYAYKITYYDIDGTTVLGYSNADGIVGADGNVIKENDEAIQTTGDYIVHPAFTANANIGGGFDNGSGKGVTGLWVGKFETTGTASEPTVKPGIITLKNQTANEQYKTGKSATFGESATINSHMAKNSEWGAVAYLAHSQYGTNGKKVAQNTKTVSTSGGTSTISTIYTDYVNNSTTHNAYGIYDLNGGAWERVASYVNNGGTYLSTNGETTSRDLYGATDAERATSTAYKTVYSGNGIQATDYTTSARMRGDAVCETSKSASSNTGSWFAACSYFSNLSGPFFARGGDCNYDYAGTFCFAYDDGSASGSFSFRVCLAF